MLWTSPGLFVRRSKASGYYQLTTVCFFHAGMMGGWLCASQLLSYNPTTWCVPRSLADLPCNSSPMRQFGFWGGGGGGWAKERAVSFSARRTSLNQVRIDRHDGPSDLPRPGPALFTFLCGSNSMATLFSELLDRQRQMRMSTAMDI
jgi:hypothetical protein